MFYADSHIHLQDYKTKDIKSIVQNAQNFKVRRFVNVSAHPSDWAQVAAISGEYPSFVAAYGVHPWYVAATPADWAENLERRLVENPRAWVGECGFDRLKNADMAAQAAVFETQLALAQKYERPLIIHAVKADDVMAQYFDRLPTRTVFHSWTGSAQWGRQIQMHGFFIGLNFSILRKKNAAELVQSLDLTRLLIETDGPYQSGEKDVETMPQNLPQLAQKIAQLRGIDSDELAEILYQNWLNFSGENDATDA